MGARVPRNQVLTARPGGKDSRAGGPFKYPSDMAPALDTSARGPPCAQA